MRKRQLKHEEQLKSIEGVDPIEVIRRINISDYKSPDYLDSEVLAALIRNRVHELSGVVNEAAVILNKRIQIHVRRYLNAFWIGMEDRDNTVVENTICYVWDKLLEDEGISNCEVYFVVFVRNRVEDYMRHLLAKKNSMESLDAMVVKDDEGNQSSILDKIYDEDTETPEEILMHVQQSAALRGMLMSLPQMERNAFYFRIECQYNWGKVADFLECSIPTARQHLRRSIEKLQGVMA